MSKKIYVPYSGIHTVEGQVSGHRAAQLAKERDAGFEKLQVSLEALTAKKGGIKIKDKFTSTDTTRPTIDDLHGPNKNEEREQEAKASSRKGLGKDATAPKKKKKLTLSFEEDEVVEEQIALFKKKAKKNPEVETSFLPDRERELQIAKDRERLRLEWQEQQIKIREEILEVVYSYWDGTGHRRCIELKKGTTIGQFLEEVRKQLSKEFREALTTSADEYMYVKEDLIIPHSYSFYDLIITKARGKSGPLFHFDVHDDVRLVGDATVEKDESHPGKVVSRRWYDRNKHIFPASRWEIYDPQVKRSDPYKIK